jgi:hypothetical protein
MTIGYDIYEFTNLTIRDIEDLGSAVVVKVQDIENYKSRSFTILGKFYVEICRKYSRWTNKTGTKMTIT